MGAGLRLFAEKGPDAVAIDDVVAAADLAKGTFYNHFDSKDALADAVARAIRARVEAAIGAANAGLADPALRCVRAIGVYLRFAEAHPDDARALARIDARLFQAQASLNAGLESDLAAGLEAGRFTAPSVAAARTFVIGVALGLLGAVLAGQAARPVFADAAVMLLKGLGVGAGEALRLARQAEAIFERGETP